MNAFSEKELSPEPEDSKRFYFIYGLMLLAMAAAGWIASRYWYRK
jgi:hypothetical protein